MNCVIVLIPFEKAEFLVKQISEHAVCIPLDSSHSLNLLKCYNVPVNSPSYPVKQKSEEKSYRFNIRCAR